MATIPSKDTLSACAAADACQLANTRLPNGQAAIDGLVASDVLVISVSVNGGAAADILEFTVPADIGSVDVDAIVSLAMNAHA